MQNKPIILKSYNSPFTYSHAAGDYMFDDDKLLTSEQISMLKNPPFGGPLHEVSMSQKKLIDNGYLERDTSKEEYQLTEKGKYAVDNYDKLNRR